MRSLTLFAALSALALLAFPVLAAHPANAAGTAGLHYAIGVPSCQRPKLHHAACTAIRRVNVSKSTPGAIAYRDNLAQVGGPATSGRHSTIGPAGGLTPADFATAYGFTQTSASSSQTVGIVDAYNDPNIASDLNTFDTNYGLPACGLGTCLKVVSQTGSTSVLPANDTSGWSTEVTLDVETVHSICQSCKILLVEANSSSLMDLATSVDEAVTLGATEVTNSYGGPEAGSASIATYYNHPGVAITASSGDNGYYNYDYLGGEGAASNMSSVPASYNTVVAVGGTSLYLNQTGGRQSEAVWNDNGVKSYNEEISGYVLGASGGGCSQVFAAQPWQSHLGNWSSTGCGSDRLVADVAADADYLTGFDIYDSFLCASGCVPSAGWYTYGGTSLASPIIASLFALAGGSHGVSHPALTLYGHLGTSALYDVAVGGDGYCDGEGASTCGDHNSTASPYTMDCDYNLAGTAISPGDVACDAGVGFDGPSGVGAPSGLGAFAKTGPFGSITCTCGLTKNFLPGTLYQFDLAAKDPFPGGKVNASYSWSWGDGSAKTATITPTASHKYTKAGDYSLVVSMTDSYGMTGTATFSVQVK
jgi:hypothetical protein